LTSPGGGEHKFYIIVYRAIDIARLTVGERPALMEQVLDPLRSEAGVLPLNVAERVVIEARRAEE